MPAPLTRIFRALRFSQPAKPKALRCRRAFLETLEPRYALTAPVANPDSVLVDINTSAIPTTGQILVLNNDTDVDSLHSELKVAEVNGTAVPNVTTDINYSLASGTLTLVYQNGHHEHFIYTPNENFTGTDSFTYSASDGASLSNAATVSISVNPVADAGDGYAIYEGGFDLTTQGPLVLDASTSRGVGNTYFWSIDGQPVGPVSGSTSPTLQLSWADLNTIGIDDGNVSVPVSLTVVDGNGRSDTDTIGLDVVNVDPLISLFEVTPGVGGGCGPVSYHLEALFSEPNSLETPLQVWVDWNLDFGAGENPFNGISPDAVQLTGYVPAGVDDQGFPQYAIEADHNYPEGSFTVFIWVVAPGYDFGPPLSEIGMNAASIEVVGGGGTATPPEATINGPVSGNEGTAIDLTSTVIQSSCGGTATYAWSVTKNGNAYGTPASTPTFAFTPDDDGMYVVTLVVTDAGGPTTATQTITVGNVAPTAVLAGDSAGVPTQVLSFTVALDDASSIDRGDLVASINWGETPPAPQAINSLNTTLTHAYASAGTYTVTVSVTDDHGTVTTTHVVTIANSVNVNGTTFAMQAGNLTVTAPAANNTIALSVGSLIVTVDGIPTKFDPVPASVTIDGGDGNDLITVASGITTPVIVHGGAGNDTLIGGSGNDKLNGGSGADILLGENGNDVLVGGAGRDIIVGGDGKDALHGKNEDDILISGIVDFGSGNLNAALAAVQAEWLSNNGFMTRTANIEGWGSNPTAYQLNSSTVSDDNDQDTLTGDQGIDWYFANLWLDNGDDANQKDKLVDINLFELLFANDLDF
jgi:hypothetical protein